MAHILAQVDDPTSDEEYAEAKKKIDAIYDELVKDPSQFGKIASERATAPPRPMKANSRRSTRTA